ncbi:rab effector Noc2-like isoform X1 [Pyxicephalus adspersus]|uniref:rab effector Noc2-like isoform X1 n=1 Tax=Pyxicephalus adspersus TaxID=30357 RepID=UPI003B5A48BC
MPFSYTFFLQVWKRSGAWFYKGIPKYILPLKISNKTSEIHLRNIQSEPQFQELRTATMNRTYTWAKGRVASSDSESDSEISTSSLEDKTSVLEDKSRNIRIDSVSSTEPTLTPTTRKHLGGMLSSGLSGSLTSLGSDRGGTVSASESYPGEHIEGYDSDISRRGPEEKTAKYLNRRNARHVMGITLNIPFSCVLTHHN